MIKLFFDDNALIEMRQIKWPHGNLYGYQPLKGISGDSWVCFLPEIEAWLAENMKYRLCIRFRGAVGEAQFRQPLPMGWEVSFGCEHDAVLFKMRWL
jgi:hypothetical protein